MPVRLLSALAVVCLTFALPARAFDPTGDAVADGVLAALANWRDEVTSVGEVEVNEDRVLVFDVEVQARGLDETYTLDVIEIVNGRMDGDTLVADTVHWRGYHHTARDEQIGTWTTGFVEMTDTDARFAPESLAVGGPLSALFRARAGSTVEGFVTGIPGGCLEVPVLKMRPMPETNGVQRLEFILEDFVIEPTVQIDPQTRRLLADASLNPLRGDLYLVLSYDHAAATMTIDDLRFSVDDIGTLTAMFQLAGLDDNSWSEFTRLSDRYEPLSGDAASVAIAGLSIRYEDAGGARTLVEFAAQSMGLRQDVFADVIAVATPGLLAAVNDADAVAQMADAVRTFLLDPQSIRIVAQPETPITFSELEQSQDESVFARFNLTIEAP